LKVLALDTSTPRGSIALLQGRDICAEFHLHSLETHSARLLGSIEFLLSMLGWNLTDLDLVVSGIGPGSFTGIRIGVSTALGLAQTRSIPFAGVSGLDAIAQKLAAIEGPIGAVLDAQRLQVYYAEYVCTRGRIKKSGRPVLMKPLELKSVLGKRHVSLCGDGAIRYKNELDLSRSGWPRLVEADLFLAGSMGRIALERKRSWRSGEYLLSEPLYIRPPDAHKGKVKHR
jgi:tRNA threonylcarbamoyladenosine biosynthesis protein TsaB